MSREAMQMALDALVFASYEDRDYDDVCDQKVRDARNALRQALETEQEPVAWASSLDFDDDDQEIIPAEDKGKLGTSNCDIPLYTAPPKHDYVIDCPKCGHCCPERTWAGLTDEEIQDLSHLYQKIDASNSPWFDRWEFARAIEAKLQEKNL